MPQRRGHSLSCFFQLRLCHGRCVRDVPQRRGLGRVCLAAGQVAQEPALRRGARGPADGELEHAVALELADKRPVVDLAEQLLVRDLVLSGLLGAQLHEVAPRNRHLSFAIRLGGRHERRVVLETGVASHAEADLHAAFRW